MKNYCKIYFSSKEELSNIENDINYIFLNINNRGNSNIYLNKNEDFDKKKEVVFPDGFLHFKYILDFEPEDIEENECVFIVNILLKWFWVNCIPAIASCDYECKLVNKGGYKSELIPFPKW